MTRLFSYEGEIFNRKCIKSVETDALGGAQRIYILPLWHGAIASGTVLDSLSLKLLYRKKLKIGQVSCKYFFKL